MPFDPLSMLLGVPGMAPTMDLVGGADPSVMGPIRTMFPQIRQMYENQAALPGLENMIGIMQPRPEADAAFAAWQRGMMTPPEQPNPIGAGAASILGNMGDVLRGGGSQVGATNAATAISMKRSDLLMKRLDTLSALEAAYQKAAKSAEGVDEGTRLQLLTKRDTMLKQIEQVTTSLRDLGITGANISAAAARSSAENVSAERRTQMSTNAELEAARIHAAATRDAAGIRAGGQLAVPAVRMVDYQKQVAAYQKPLRTGKNQKEQAGDREERMNMLAGAVLTPIIGEGPRQAAVRIARELPTPEPDRKKFPRLPGAITFDNVFAQVENLPPQDQQPFVETLSKQLYNRWKPWLQFDKDGRLLQIQKNKAAAAAVGELQQVLQSLYQQKGWQ